MYNEKMRDKLFEKLESDEAKGIFEVICKLVSDRDGTLYESDQTLIGDYAMLEDLKLKLIEDIKDRGLGEMRRNGRQEYYKENVSVNQLRSVIDQQRRQLKELRLTPDSRKAVQQLGLDDFESFE